VSETRLAFGAAPRRAELGRLSMPLWLFCGLEIATNRSLQPGIESFLETLVTSPFPPQYRVFLGEEVLNEDFPITKRTKSWSLGTTLRTLRVVVACRENL
jgi:hypothetical protein